MVPPAAEAQRGFVRGDFFFLGLEKKREASNQTCTLTGWLKEMLHLLLQASIFPHL